MDASVEVVDCTPSPPTCSVDVDVSAADGDELFGDGNPINVSNEVGDNSFVSENVNENVQGLGGVGDEDVQVPTLGMTFRSWEDVEAMYKLYGKATGFGVARTQAAFNANRERRAMTWKCECWGVPNIKHLRALKKREEDVANGGTAVAKLPKVRSRKSKKCQCTAMIYASMNREDLWEVKQVVLEHSGHNPIPADSRLVKEYRMHSFTSNLRNRVLNDVEVGVPIDQIHGSVARERDGLANMPVTPKDMRHVADKARKLKLKGGDSKALMGYLDRMRRDNNEFFYSIRMDVTGGLQDVFWVDARSKAAYEEFGDVVCFDTTYMVNDYDLPFANFVGVNHHGQTTLFGCALISHEDVETFTWVFQKWLDCMGGKAPGAILTDQAAAMIRPIKDVFPHTIHRWCIWHIMSKIPTKLGGYSRYKKIKRAIKEVVYNSFCPTDFEDGWNRVIRKYRLRRNDWLRDLFVDRQKWVPAYMRDTFWAGMRSTQRVESIHSFFDKFVKTHTSLIEFGEKYIAAVEKRMCQERDADDRDRKWHRLPATKLALELYFADLYTDEKFLEHSKQCERVMYGFVSSEREVDDGHVEYVINDQVWVFKEGCRSDKLTDMRRLYRVLFNTHSHQAVCECRMFETNGIMCRHIIRVLYQNNITVPPEVYVLHRWKKNVDRRHTRIKVAYHDPRRTQEVKRVDRMQVVFDILSDKAAWHETRTRLVIETLTKLINEVDSLHDEDLRTEGPQGNGYGSNDVQNGTVHDSGDVEVGRHHDEPRTTRQQNTPAEQSQLNGVVTQTLRDPVRRKKRGRPKGSRSKGVAELVADKCKRKKSGKKAESSTSDTNETKSGSASPSPSPTPSPINTRSKKGTKTRKRAMKRLEVEFNTSSDDESASF